MPKRVSKSTAATKASTKKIVETTVRPPDKAGERSVYFLSLTVRNIRCFGNTPQTLNLRTEADHWAPWTIILGNNGVGKSTLLQLLCSANVIQRPQDSINFDPFFTEGSSPSFVRKGVDAESIDELIQLDQLENQITSTVFPWCAVDMCLTANSTADVASVIRVAAVGNEWASRSFISSGDTSGARLHVFGYGPWRRVERSTLARSDLSSKRSHLLNENADLINAEEWLLRLDYSNARLRGDRKLARREHQVRDVLIELLPDVNDLRIAWSNDSTPAPSVEFLTPFGWIRLQALGYGYQSLIAWVVDFAARMFEAYPESLNPLVEPAVCLIDEIDLHLHPTWQRKVMRYLSDRFPKTQFIATAHSPLIVQSAPEIGANVAVLRREGDHVVILNNPVDVMGWRADQILSSELFDEVPLRSDTVQAVVNERTRLLSKPKLAPAEKARLKELDAQVNALPAGSTANDREVAQQLKSAVDLLDRVTANQR
jgi:putative AbiEii toxin of type IV toxin-antitoxin system/AAA domain-containing protein